MLAPFYVADFLLITIPSYTVFWPRMRSANALLWSLIGGMLFAVSAPIWSVVVGHLDVQDMLFHSGLAFIAGGLSFFVISRRNRAGNQ